jgi:hypothetical protein
MTIEIRRKKFTVDEYEQVGRAGILGEDGRVACHVSDGISGAAKYPAV